MIVAPAGSRSLATHLVTATPTRVIHRNRRSTVAEIVVDGEHFARKTYRTRLPLPPPFPSPARHTWKLLMRGREEGLPFPEPIAFADAKWGGRATVITRWFPGDHLHLTHARHREELREPAARRAFATAVGEGLVTLFRAGLRTRDLAPQNLLVAGGAGEPWRVCLVDLDDAQLGGSVRPERIIECLAQLGHLPATISAGERLLGLQCFLDAGGEEFLAEWIEKNGRAALRQTLVERIDLLTDAKQKRLEARGAADHPYAGFGLDAEGNPVR